ncbi:Gfo/Idh/MocA family protein [Parabacteroides bouchesdurhonensis]|uniref:Gfo/Idh/MocA family protein n=1 Tax=Parabacteroides bouchesdurhonensis TaxID=1936995 RepID=UPI000E52C9B8|nr:Gfo/Idh/MocA family oxidoreductase [Parabacteroides bouchesdurhonensis]RHJ91695.1 gfo/Idh/MocA family oxidoreductase [Bacteroides sp. AM07-16]
MEKNKISTYLILLSTLLLIPFYSQAQNPAPLRLAVAGVSHAHLHEVIVRMDRGDFQIVGVAEKDDKVRENNGLRKKLDPSLFYADLGEMLDKTKPEVVVAYGSIYDHLEVVEACAPRGIDVMVEKPLAVNMQHASRMAELARANKTLVLTNYETSWYDTNHEAYQLIKNGEIGNITRINVYDGHQGPIEIGCGREFTDWLTDPVQNGGGAVMDFGCYGANLVTWLLNGQKPTSVYAVLNRQKPAIYPKVDDDATIIAEYPDMTVQIMASWNWPMNRKDMHIYGSKGYIYQDTPTQMRVYTQKGGKEVSKAAPRLASPYNDSFYYLKAVVRKQIEVKPTDLASLENNLVVVEILESAIKSAQTGKAIEIK